MCIRKLYIDQTQQRTQLSRVFNQTSISCDLNYILNLGNNMQGKRIQYRLKDKFWGTVDSAMGDIVSSVATSMSIHDHTYCLWAKCQLLVIII